MWGSCKLAGSKSQPHEIQSSDLKFTLWNLHLSQSLSKDFMIYMISSNLYLYEVGDVDIQ